MNHNEELRNREKPRRKALWALASHTPEDPRALDAHEISGPVTVFTVGQLRDAIPIEPPPIGCRIVREENILLPWRERFLHASLGSTRVPEGPYAHDWEKFLNEWEQEMQHLENHRDAAGIAGFE